MKRDKQYVPGFRLPSPKQLVVSAVRVPGAGKLTAKLDCGHTITGATAYKGQERWCPTCHPPRTVIGQ